MMAHGGGAFLLVYALVLFLAAVPVVMAELALARRSHLSALPTLRSMSEGKRLQFLMPWAGWAMMLAACVLLGLYGLVGGLSLAYVFLAALGELHGNSPKAAASFFSSFLGSQYDLGFWLVVFMALVVAVSMRGLQRGLQRSLRTIVPLLFVVVLVLSAVGLMSGKAGEASWTLFAFRWEDLGWYGGLQAASLAFYSLAIGSGVVMTLGAYMPGNASVPLSAIGVAVTDLIVTLLLGLAVVALLFANQVASVSGFELVFVALPQVFDAMPAGQLVGSLFYVLVVLLAWTTALFVMEVLVARISEVVGGLRGLAVILAAAPGVLVGIIAVRGVAVENGPDYFFWMSQAAALVLIPVGVIGVVLLVGRLLHPMHVVSFLGLTGVPFRFWRFMAGSVVPILVVVIVGFGVYEQIAVHCERGGWLCWQTARQAPIVPVFEEPHGAVLDNDPED